MALDQRQPTLNRESTERKHSLIFVSQLPATSWTTLLTGGLPIHYQKLAHSLSNRAIRSLFYMLIVLVQRPNHFRMNA